MLRPVRLFLVACALAVVAGCRSVPPPADMPVNQAERERASRDSTSRQQGGIAEGYGASAEQAYPAEARAGHRRSRRRRSQAESQATPGQFDFYLLNLSWSPEFCATHQSPECGKGLGFVVHGLWPQDNTGDYPEDCSDAPGPANPQGDTDLQPTVSLVEHEWKTHGTCSGLAADAYFNEVRSAFHEVKLPAVGGGGDAGGVAPGALLARFQTANPSFPAGSFALSCGNNRLTAVEVCLTKTLQPEACQGVKSCGATSVQVTPQ